MSGHVTREHFPSRQINFVFFGLLNYPSTFLTVGWTLVMIKKRFKFNSMYTRIRHTWNSQESCACKKKKKPPHTYFFNFVFLFLQLCLYQSLLTVFLSEWLKPDLSSEQPHCSYLSRLHAVNTSSRNELKSPLGPWNTPSKAAQVLFLRDIHTTLYTSALTSSFNDAPKTITIQEGSKSDWST